MLHSPNFVFSQKIAMTSPLKLQLCQEDPPQFRKELADCENSVFGLENTIKNLVKLARSNVELASG
jgi:Arf-GAP/coiled-coil/ANK repeat/PH domain-containing protein